MTEIVNEVRLGASQMLDNLKISSADFLDDLTGRSVCPKCSKSRKYFCYTCYVAMEEVEDRIPKLKLPIKVDIIKHPKEVDGKSTATHAAVLAPDEVSIFTYPYIPAYENKEKLLMIFPGNNSVTLEQLMKKLNLENIPSDGDEAAETRFPRNTNSCGSCKHNSDSTDNCDDISKSCAVNYSPETDIRNPENVHNHSTYLLMEGNPRLDRSDNVSESENDRSGNILKSKFPFERVILIDSTWNQVRAIRMDARLQGVACRTEARGRLL